MTNSETSQFCQGCGQKQQGAATPEHVPRFAKELRRVGLTLALFGIPMILWGALLAYEAFGALTQQDEVGIGQSLYAALVAGGAFEMALTGLLFVLLGTWLTGKRVVMRCSVCKMIFGVIEP